MRRGCLAGGYRGGGETVVGESEREGRRAELRPGDPSSAGSSPPPPRGGLNLKWRRLFPLSRSSPAEPSRRRPARGTKNNGGWRRRAGSGGNGAAAAAATLSPRGGDDSAAVQGSGEGAVAGTLLSRHRRPLDLRACREKQPWAIAPGRLPHGVGGPFLFSGGEKAPSPGVDRRLTRPCLASTGLTSAAGIPFGCSGDSGAGVCPGSQPRFFPSFSYPPISSPNATWPPSPR